MSHQLDEGFSGRLVWSILLHAFTEALGSALLCSDPLGSARIRSDLLGFAHSAPAHTLSKFYRMMYSKEVKAAVRKRAHQRWWALMHRVEVSNGMRDHLGDTGWVSFKGFCIDHFRHSFLALFDPCCGVLRCSGPLCGGPCPHNHQVDFAAATALRQMEALHLDHAFDVQHICELWKQLTPRDPVSWDQGIKGMMVAHLLFGTRTSAVTPPTLACGVASLGALLSPCTESEFICATSSMALTTLMCCTLMSFATCPRPKGCDRARW